MVFQPATQLRPERGTLPQPASPLRAEAPHEGRKSYLVALLLSFVFGMWGIDRFYLGKTGTGLLKLLTFGGFGFWWLIDLLITLFGSQRDKLGLRLSGYEARKRGVWLGIGACLGFFVVLGALAATFMQLWQFDAPSALAWGFVGSLSVGLGVWAARLVRRGRS